MELVFVIKHFLHRIDLEELRASAASDISTQVGNTVFESHIALLAQHTDCSQEQFLVIDMLLLIHGNHTVAEMQQALELVNP